LPSCNQCQEPFDDYESLAHHIVENKKSHKRGRAWALRYLATHNLSQKALKGKLEGRSPLTSEQREAKQSTVRELSGQLKYVPTFCPKCKSHEYQKLEIEYVESPHAWRMSGELVKLCVDCR
jgi:hypothetical protein